jgi:RHS repeat-associated protein
MVLVDEVFNSTGTPTDILWLLHDHQNTVADVATMSSTSGPGTLRNHLEYNAFGAITSQTNATYAPLQTYTGQILDTTTGLLFYDARWYDPILGRFVSEDPIGFAAGDANLTRYVGNSFANAVDPTGLDDVPVVDVSDKEREARDREHAAARARQTTAELEAARKRRSWPGPFRWSLRVSCGSRHPEDDVHGRPAG